MVHRDVDGRAARRAVRRDGDIAPVLDEIEAAGPYGGDAIRARWIRER